jgi:serine/threonine protein kinase/WD40 repeat protein
MTTQTCPDQTTLENFLLGKLSATEQSAVSEHLQSCSQCTASANTLMPQDEITQAIRARRVLTGDEGAVALAAEKGKLLSSQLQTMQPDETVIGDNVQIPPADPNATVTFGSVQTPDEALNFLAPAQGPDELGRLGDYRILELLGMGGMGMVFRAEDARLKRQVALKVMKPSVAASRTAKDRFLREAQFTAAIEHDNIVQIFQVGEDNGVPFIAMPFLKGESLKTRQERVGRMSQKDVLKVGIQVAAGLAAAHDRNLIHRDIKPDNIWIEEKTGRAKILDFGLVRATSEDAGLTQSGMVMGTPRYMAPEQALGQDVDHRCDLFSLGSVLYHLASGKLPFEGSNVTATLMAVVQKDPKPLDAVISGLDPAFCDMITRLMRKNRDDRPKSAVEVAKALTAILQKLKQVDPTVTKAESTPKSEVESAKPEKAAGEIEALPVIVTEPVASLATKKAVKPKDTPAASSIQPPDKPPRRRFLAAAGAGGILLALLGIIVITIRDKDGKETVIRVPEGTEIDVKADPGSKVTIRQEAAGEKSASKMAAASSTSPQSPQPATESSQTSFTPVKPMVEMDLTPAPPLGTWQMGPEPPWYSQDFTAFDYSLKEAAVLPGIVDRPALIPGIKRWNVDTVWPRGGIVEVAYSPDGKWIGVLDTHLSIFNAKTLKLHQLLPGFAPQYGAFDISWSSDSQRIVVAADRATKVRVFDVKGNLHHEAALRGTTQAVAWNPAADQFAVGIYNAANHGSCIEIYNAAGELLKSFPEEAATSDLGVHKQGIIFSRDGKSLVAVHHDGKVRSWNIETGESKIIDEISVIFSAGSGLSWHESGWLAINSQTDVRIYSPDLKLDHTIPIEGVGDVKWHADGRRLLLGAGWLQVWDRIERKIVLSGEGRLQCGSLESADWSPDGEEVVFTTNQGSLLGVAPASFKQTRFQSPRGAQAYLVDIDWSPYGGTLAIGLGYYGPVKLLAANGTLIQTLIELTPTLGGWITWSTDGKELFGGNASGVWAATREGTVRDLYRSDRLYWWGSLVNSPNGRVVIVSRTDGHLQILDRAGKTIEELPTGGNSIPYIAWNHETDVIAVAEPGQPLKFLDHDNGWTLRTVSDVPLPHFQKAPVWSPDGKMLSIQEPGLWFDDTGKSLPKQAPAEAWRPDGQCYVNPWIGYLAVHNRQGSLLKSRYPQGLLSAACAWQPRGHLFATGTTSSRFTVWNEAEVQPYFHGVILPDDKFVTFSAAGELLDGKPEEIDPYLVYYIDRGDGRIETLTPAEFRKLLPGK